MSVYEIPPTSSVKMSLAGKEIYASLSLNKLIFLGDATQQDRSDYKQILIDMLSECEGLPKSKLTKDFLDDYIRASLESDENLKEKYDSVAVDDNYAKYVKAALKLLEDLSKTIVEVAKNIAIPKIDFSKIMPRVSVNYDMSKMLGLSAALESIQIFNRSWATQLAETMRAIRTPFTDINLDAFKEFQKSLSDVIKDIKIPRYYEESYRAWGKLGWTLPSFVEGPVFNGFPPSDSKSAHKKMNRHFSGGAINEVFDELRKMDIKQSDLKEAIECYEHRHYKACSMLLFAMIDAPLIRSQTDEDRKRNRGGRRPTGKTAGTNVLNRAMVNISDSPFSDFLWYANISEAFAKVFADGGDFLTQPDIINRNFVYHGMLHRKVWRRDCIQLFLLLYNMTLLFESLED